MKITTQLLATMNVLLMVAFGSVASVYLNKINNSRVVNYTGIVRGATQRLIKLEMAGQESDELILNLDAIVNGLINSDAGLDLPAATDPEFLLKMQEVEAAWEELKVTIERVRRDPNVADELVAESENYFELTNEAVFAAEDFSKATAQRVRIIQLFILAVNLVVIVFIWYVIRRITSTLQESTTSIASSSTEIAATMAQQERSISEQAMAVSETTTSMEELGASTRQSSEQAAASTAGARQALELAEEGNKAVEQTLEGITTLKAQVGSIAEQIMRLSEQSGKISLVSELVGDIANQTNMLALNASVEAVRVGESGKGFSVVAGEIRKLADQSKKSAENINDLVRNIQASLNSTVVVTDEGIKKADMGIELVQQTAETFASVSDAINNVFFNTQQISMTAKQQALAVQQVVSAISQLNGAAQETAAGIHQVKLSTQQLNGAAKSLKAAV